MKKSLGLSLAAATLLAGNAFAMDLAGGTLTGDVRAAYHGHATSEYDDASGTTHDSEDYNALGLGINPTFSIEAVSNLTVEVGAGVAMPVSESEDLAATHFAMAKENSDGDASEMYALLNIYNVAYNFGSGFVKVGAQELDTPFAGPDDIRLVKNTFTAAIAAYTGIEKVTLLGGQVFSMAGKFDSLAVEDAEQYQSMSDAALGGTGLAATNDDIDDNGVTVLAGIYNNEDAGANGQFWYYTMPETTIDNAGTDVTVDAVTAMYLDAGMAFGQVNASVQYISQDIGGDKATSYGLMADIAATDDVGVTVAYNSFSSDDGSAPAYYAWGGYPEYAVADEMWANSADWDGGTSTKIAASYSGVEKLDATLAYVMFSDVANVTDIILGYEVAEHLHAGFVYEMVSDESDVGPDATITKLHVSYTF